MNDFLDYIGFGTVEFWEQIAGYAWNGFQKFGAGAVVVVEEDLVDAFRTACNCVTREDLICVTGSVYLVGLAKRRLDPSVLP